VDPGRLADPIGSRVYLRRSPFPLRSAIVRQMAPSSIVKAPNRSICRESAQSLGSPADSLLEIMNRHRADPVELMTSFTLILSVRPHP
jgi:hypothetical protein